jgi:Uma2 family endonuclease
VRQAVGTGTLHLVNVPAPRHRYTYEDYLAVERTSPIKHEFFDGEIYAMAGGTPTHAQLAARLIVLLGNLTARHSVFTSDLRVLIPATGLATYPDISVIEGMPQHLPRDRDAITNPVLLVEVSSPSTESYDCTEKLAQYQQLPTLQHVLFVSHREPRLTLVSRGSEGAWTTMEAGPGEILTLTALGVTLSVDEIYRSGLADRS